METTEVVSGLLALIMFATLALLRMETDKAAEWREKAKVAEARAEIQDKMLEDWRTRRDDWKHIFSEGRKQERALVDRMLQMQREGFIDIPMFPSHDESADTSASEGWELTDQEYRDATGHQRPLPSLDAHPGYAMGNPGMDA